MSNFRIFIFMFGFCATMCVVPMLMNNMEYHVNLHASDITDTHHTYKIYDSWTDSMLGRNPIKSLSIPIMQNGNYPGNPSKNEMRQWIICCESDINWFTLSRL